MDVAPSSAYRVLIKLADHADQWGKSAWRDNAQLAVELGTSKRTIERAIRDLKVLGLIKPGDQRLVGHIRPDRRPTVYDLNLQFARVETAPEPLPMPVDNPASGPSDLSQSGPSDLSRADEIGSSGPTTGVAHRTVQEPDNSPSRSNHTTRTREAVDSWPYVEHMGDLSNRVCHDRPDPVNPHYCTLGHRLSSLQLKEPPLEYKARLTAWERQRDDENSAERSARREASHV
jgi:hypothetical protein